METDVNEHIHRLKAEGRSLREIASVLGVSHVAVLKRLRAMEGNRLVNSKDLERLPRITEAEDNGETPSIPHQSSLCHESKGGGNQVVTRMPPSSLVWGKLVTLQEALFKLLIRGIKELFQTSLMTSSSLLRFS